METAVQCVRKGVKNVVAAKQDLIKPMEFQSYCVVVTIIAINP